MRLVKVEHIEPDDPSHRGRWYVVIAGPRVGIWKYWLDVEGYTMVHGAKYQRMDFYADAKALYDRAMAKGRVMLLPA